MPGPPPPSTSQPKSMSSRLSSMKFMQRAAAAASSRTPSHSQPHTPQTPQSVSDPALPPAKRLRTSTSTTISILGTPGSAPKSVNGVALPSGEKSGTDEPDQWITGLGPEAKETKWEFNWVPEEGTINDGVNGGAGTPNGGIQAQKVDSWVWSIEGNSDGDFWARRNKAVHHQWEGDDSIARRAFGPLKRRKGGTQDTPLSISDSEEESEDDVSDKGCSDGGNVGADAAAMIKQEQRAQRKAEKKLEKAAKIISARAAREQNAPKERVKLSRLTSISAQKPSNMKR